VTEMANASVGMIGDPVRRKEDLRLLTGKACYSDDFNLPGQAYAVMVRSPHAHAAIRAIDASRALVLPGVLAVLTGAAAAADGLRSIVHTPVSGSPPDIPLNNSDGSDKRVSPHLPLPTDRARFVGEAVAMVLAETVAIAKDAAELVAVEWEPLEAVTHAIVAIEAAAPLLWDAIPENVSIDASVGDAIATEAAFAKARHIVRLDTWVQRVTGVPMEPRAALGDYDAATGRYTLYAGGGGVVRPKQTCAAVLGVPDDRVRAISRDVGGNFGTRNAIFPEFPLVLWASRRLGRPVKWTAERGEAFLSDYQGRDLAVDAEIALDAKGTIVAMRGSNISNLGAHTVSFVPLTKGVELMTGVYRIPAAHFRARAAHSTTPPTNPYRSAGRPEAMFVIERLLDKAAQEHGFDRVALRRRNIVRPAEMPFANALGMTYDNGEYESVMDKAMALGDWSGFAQRKAESRGRGKLRGIGIANYVEATSGFPREWTEITVKPDGVDVAIGTLASGQGHETSFAQLVTEWLGVPFERVTLITGDTDRVLAGGGSHSGRSMRYASIVIGIATDAIIAKGKQIAGFILEASALDLDFAAGNFTVKGTDRSIGLFEVASAAVTRRDLPAELKGPLAAISDETQKVCAFPYGSHVCEVEIDPETGVVALLRYAAVDDVGRAVNPLILHGQAHGGIVQGVGQALLEQCVYDSASGQLLSGSFMDYAMPRARDMPSFATEISEVPSPSNRLGIRAGGEGGTTPALAVVINAIVDALAEYGVTHIEMPATPERIWRAIHDSLAETA
jgi:aerobic carbon-monoxide dehydrogenase large subunit